MWCSQDRRRVKSNGSILINNRTYYVKRTLQGQSVTVVVDGVARELIIEHNKHVTSTFPSKTCTASPSISRFILTQSVRKLRHTGDG